MATLLQLSVGQSERSIGFGANFGANRAAAVSASRRLACGKLKLAASTTRDVATASRGKIRLPPRGFICVYVIFEDVRLTPGFREHSRQSDTHIVRFRMTLDFPHTLHLPLDCFIAIYSVPGLHFPSIKAERPPLPVMELTAFFKACFQGLKLI